jgi:hypothetical protein
MIVCEDDGTRRAFDHTVVGPEHCGRGITTMLVKAALDDLRAKELTLTNYCRFVADFIVGHPDYADLVDASRSGRVRRR